MTPDAAASGGALYMGMNFATQASSMTGATFFWISLTVTVQAAECVVPSAPVICRITLVEPAAAAVAVTL